MGKTSEIDDKITRLNKAKTRLNNVISTRLKTVFSQCLKVPPSVKKILIDNKKESSDYICIYDKTEIIRKMIKLFDVSDAHRETTKLTFEMLHCISLNKACAEWNFCINSEKSHAKEMLKESEVSNLEEFAIAETKDDDDVDNRKYNSDDLPPYTPTVKKYPSELHDSSKTLTRSINTSSRKRKLKNRYKPNPLCAD